MLAKISHEFAQYVPWLTAIAVKASLLLLIALVTGQLLRRASAALRHVLYVATILGIVLLPLAAMLLPDLKVPILPPHSAGPASVEKMTPADIESMPNAIFPQSEITKSAQLKPHNRKSDAAIPAVEGAVALPRHAVSRSPQTGAPVSPQTSDWRGILVLVWIAGCAGCLLRMLVIQLQLGRLVKGSVPVDSIPLSSRLRWLCRDLGIKQEVTLLASHELDVPIAVGVLSPKIVLSPQAGEWTETRRNAVLCHELAHIKRGDAFTQFLASVAAAVYWFNPLVWMVARAMRAERERACDDYVLAYGTAASDYAHELVEIVSTLVRPQPAAALAMARRSQLEGRVMALLNARVTHGVPRRMTTVGFVGVVLVVALPLAAARLEERPGHEIWAIPSAATGSIYVGTVPANVETTASPDPAAAPQPTDSSSPGIGIPIYPNAVAGDHLDGRGTVSLTDSVHVHHLAAAAYYSQDDPGKVLAFYRSKLKSHGEVIECAGGSNSKVDVQVDQQAIANPAVCRAEDFAQNGTELKVSKAGDQRIVVIQPHGSGSEIALVRLDPFGIDSGEAEESHNETSTVTFNCFQGNHSNQSSVSSHSDNGYRTWTATWTGNGCSIEARSSGEVRFSPDATSIESISSGGYFEVNERTGGDLRRVRVEPSSGGSLTYDYSVNGSKHEFDTEARGWLSKLLLQLERATGFSASTRVPALLKQGGPEAVLKEITQLQSDYVRQVYFTKLFENATLPAPLLVKALNQAREEIDTDYSLAQVLLTIAQRYNLNDEAQRTAFLNGADKLGTDYEHARVLIELLKRPNLSPQIVRGTLESAKRISTDYEKSRILTTLAGLSTFDQSEISSYLDLASSIGTDYEHSRSLLALMDHQKLTPDATSQVLRSATTIGTDYEKSRILLGLSQSHNFDEKQIATYLTLVDSVGTDYERSRDLIALMQQHKLANGSVLKVLTETQKIGTDYEKARVLTEAAKQYQMQGTLRDAYIKAADSIGTEYDRNRTLAAITKRDIT